MSQLSIFSSKEKSKFHVELNYGLALPFKFYIDDKYDLTQEHRAEVTDVDDSGSIHRLEVITQSNMGPLGGFENDVLLVLLTMAVEQKDSAHNKNSKEGFKVYYTLSGIAKRLDLVPKNWTSRIKLAIEKIKSQEIRTKNFSYNANTGDITMVTPEDGTKLIKTGVVRIGNTSKDFKGGYHQLFYATFDFYVFDNLYGQYASVISSNDYLRLKIGPQRRTFIFLNSKKEKFGNSFGFKLDELASVLGISNAKKKRRQVGDYLKGIKDILGNIDFGIKKQRGVEEWDVWVECFEEGDLLTNNSDEVYAAFLEEYGIEFFKDKDFQELDLKIIRKEFNSYYLRKTGKEFHEIRKGVEVSPADLAIDIALFQAKYLNYPITSIKGLSKKILEAMIDGILELPEKYRLFVVDRIRERKKERQRISIERERERRGEEEREKREKLEKSFELVYEKITKNNNTYLKQLKEKAIKNLEEVEKIDGVFPESLKSLFIETKIKEIAKDEWFSGEFLNQDFNELNSMKIDQKASNGSSAEISFQS